MEKDIRIDNQLLIVSPKLLRKFTMMIFADIHYYSHKEQKYLLDKLLQLVINNRPDFLSIPGDLFDTSDVLFNPEELNYLMNWLKLLSNYTTIYITIGNHEIMALRNGKWESYEKIARERLDTIFKDAGSGINLLKNEPFIDRDKGISFRGLSFSFKAHEEEDKDEYLKTLNNFKDNLNIDNSLFNILLTHPNVFVHNGKINYEEFENYPFDFTASGHNHGGLLNRNIATLLDYISNRHYGLISFKNEHNQIKRQFLSSDSYGIVSQDNKVLLNSRGTTKISDSKGAIKVFNSAFGIDVDMIEFRPSDDKSSNLCLIKR